MARSARHFAVGAAGRRSRARPAAPSEAAHSTLVGVPDTRIDRIRQVHRHALVGVSADHFERSNRGVQVVPPLLLQFAVGVKRLRIRINISRRLRKVALYDVNRRNPTMAWLQGKGGTRPEAESRQHPDVSPHFHAMPNAWEKDRFWRRSS